jgi:hypothetical protein
MIEANQARQRMSNEPFSPAQGNEIDRQTHAAEYIAFYLGEITNHLAAISGHLHNANVSGSSIGKDLKAIAQVLPRLVK